MLKKLSLAECGRLTDADLIEISNKCTLIESLSLDGSYMLTDASLCKFVEEHPHLKNFSLSWMQHFTSLLTQKLSTLCSGLKTIKISKCMQVDDYMLSHLAKLSNLEEFHLEEADLITDDGLIAILSGKSLGGFRSISIVDCKQITEKAFISTIVHCKSLLHLKLEKLLEVTNCIHVAISSCVHLESLSLNGCLKLTDESISILPSSHPPITNLNLRQLSEISKNVLIELFTNLPDLISLDLSWCMKNVDDEIVDVVLKNCKKLAKISLWGCNRITDVGVNKLLKMGAEVIGKDQFRI